MATPEAWMARNSSKYDSSGCIGGDCGENGKNAKGFCGQKKSGLTVIPEGRTDPARTGGYGIRLFDGVPFWPGARGLPGCKAEPKLTNSRDWKLLQVPLAQFVSMREAVENQVQKHFGSRPVSTDSRPKPFWVGTCFG
jgi:hypothetical protein